VYSYKELQLAFQKHPSILSLKKGLESSKKGYFLASGIKGGGMSFVLNALYDVIPTSYLVITNSLEEAAYLQNTLESLISGKEIHLLPDSFKKPMRFEDLDNHNVRLRTEVINKMTSSQTKGEIVITYPEALFEKVVSPRILQKNRIEINKGEKLDVDFIIEVLVEHGFERVDFVYEPGQFSIRGGLVDVFSYGNEYPYRIELFDDEVESIRMFNPGDQLSLRNIARASIIPNINTQFSVADKTSLFQVLPKETIIVLSDFSFMQDRLQICFEEAIRFIDNLSGLDKSDVAEMLRDRAFIYPGETIDDLSENRLLYLKQPEVKLNFEVAVEFNYSPQKNFNKKINLLEEDLKNYQEKKYSSFIFSESTRQLERLQTIFEDLKSEVKFVPIAKDLFQGFVDHDLKIVCYTDHQIFERYHRYTVRKGYSKDSAMTLTILKELQPGDYVTHIDHGVGRFSGLEKLVINGHTQETVRLIYLNNDILYVGINSLHKITKYIGKEGTPPRLSKIGSDTWAKLKAKTKKQVKDIAKELIALYAKRRGSPGFEFSPDGYLQHELEASFIYEDTPDQYKTTKEVKKDMEKPYPMDRLICGDVGFGKTEIAIRAAFKAIVDGKQVAVLVPTTLLALQHFKTFSERLSNLGVTCDYINRFRTAKEKKQIFEKVKERKIDLLIGTQSILSKELNFNDLGLLIIDEEQKFGVASKEKLRHAKINVDTLTLTATPIPRTLQFSLMSARDLSIIRTPPPNRQPIATEVRVLNEDLIKDAIYQEVQRNGQVFFVHNRVKSLPDIVALVERLCPDVDVAMAHGQMDSEKLENTLVDFMDKKFDVLVCTNIIETGLDIANANTIIINDAQDFGLSDLHQLRGRVGRSNKKAYCYLIAPPLSLLTSDARKRLKTIEEFNELGSGFDISMRDMDIRGAGNILGAEQSGFISEIGLETFQKVLDEAIHELKETEFKDVFKDEISQKYDFVQDVSIETDIEMLIPDSYVSNTQERLSLYTELDKLESEEEVDKFSEKIRDRFGKLPPQVLELFEGLRLRWVGRKLAFEKLILKQGKLRGYFINNPQSPFYESALFLKLMKYVADAKNERLTLKKTGNSLILVFEGVKTLKGARKVIGDIADNIVTEVVN
jgi:transcription-repair coupling factor (superfamily II helicase)